MGAASPPATDTIAGDREATHALGMLIQLLNNLRASRRRGEEPYCFCCGKPVRNFPVIVMLIADTLAARGGIGGAIGYCCDAAEPELYARVIAVLNEHIEGGAFLPWQLHEPGHA